ncbi:hypothetical protein AB6A40_001441 [Gnathostoma spinigerum]|uniref:Prolactin receptor n=1 Tax=Gnathostoma spinigerum TaxID=75299 RepID=A0ABD6EDG3_9BILA
MDETERCCIREGGEVLSRHRGFSSKAREILLEPVAPFAVTVKKKEASTSHNQSATVAPHRGFSTKAKEMLLEREPSAPATHRSETKGKCGENTAHCPFSHSENEDTTDEETLVTSASPRTTVVSARKYDGHSPRRAGRMKAYMLLGDIGKTRSLSDIYYKPWKDPLMVPPQVTKGTSADGSTSLEKDDKKTVTNTIIEQASFSTSNDGARLGDNVEVPRRKSDGCGERTSAC